jgi:hypothetical protein
LLSTRETVATETPASRATSLIVVRIVSCGAAQERGLPPGGGRASRPPSVTGYIQRRGFGREKRDPCCYEM